MGTLYIDLEKKNIGMQQHVKEKYESRRVNHHRKEKYAGFELKSAKICVLHFHLQTKGITHTTLWVAQNVG